MRDSGGALSKTTSDQSKGLGGEGKGGEGKERPTATCAANTCTGAGTGQREPSAPRPNLHCLPPAARVFVPSMIIDEF